MNEAEKKKAIRRYKKNKVKLNKIIPKRMKTVKIKKGGNTSNGSTN